MTKFFNRKNLSLSLIIFICVQLVFILLIFIIFVDDLKRTFIGFEQNLSIHTILIINLFNSTYLKIVTFSLLFLFGLSYYKFESRITSVKKLAMIRTGYIVLLFIIIKFLAFHVILPLFNVDVIIGRTRYLCAPFIGKDDITILITSALQILVFISIYILAAGGKFLYYQLKEEKESSK